MNEIKYFCLVLIAFIMDGMFHLFVFQTMNFGPPRGNQKCRASVGALLGSFCGSLEERMTFRKYFYKDSRLVKDGILNMMGQVGQWWVVFACPRTNGSAVMEAM
jgi:hypothetical protein